MERIIWQTTLELGRKKTKKASSGELSDIYAPPYDVLTDCKSASVSIIEIICKEINFKIKEDKVTRKTTGISEILAHVPIIFFDR